MRVAIIVSVVVHVVVMIGAPLGDWKSPPESAGAFLMPVIVIEPPAPPKQSEPEPPPIEVAYLSDAQIAAIAPTAVPMHADKPSSQRVSIGVRERPGRHAASESSSGAPEKPSLMRMRKPGVEKPPVVGMSQQFLDDFMKRSKPVVIPDLPGARIDAQIADIQARMRGRNNDEWYDPTADREALVALKEQRANVELKQQKDGTYKADKETFGASIARDGTVAITDKPNLQRQGLGAKFDVTDAAMRAQGIDPYASEKRKFLDRTRDQRVAIGKEYRREVLSRSAEIMRVNLERAWRLKTTTAARKHAAFELWDEVAETGDPELVAGGIEARALLVRFVRVRLAGADAFTAEELGKLNAKRTSKAVFAP